MSEEFDLDKFLNLDHFMNKKPAAKKGKKKQSKQTKLA
jgi:hypothetical protein